MSADTLDYMNDPKWAIWRDKVFARDNYTCQGCSLHDPTGDLLHAHHIVHWEHSEQLRYEVANGATLCPKCHVKAHVHCNFHM